MSRGPKIALWVGVTLMALAAIGAFVMWGPPALGERFAQPEFCARCHEMQPMYERWAVGGHSDLESCNDCHLPNDSFVRHWFWDAVVGVRDLVNHTLGRIPEDIQATERSEVWIEENCERCHQEALDDSEHPDIDKVCWECHEDVYHASEAQKSRAPDGDEEP